MKYPYLNDPKQIIPWARQLVATLSKTPVPEEYPGPYANDAAASTAGIQLGQSYMDSSGLYRRRLT